MRVPRNQKDELPRQWRLALGTTRDLMWSYLMADFGRHNSVTPPRVVCRCPLSHGRNTEKLRGCGASIKALERKAWWNGKVRSSGAAPGAYHPFHVFRSPYFWIVTDSFAAEKIHSVALAFVSLYAVASFVHSHNCTHTHMHIELYIEIGIAVCVQCSPSPNWQDQGMVALIPH